MLQRAVFRRIVFLLAALGCAGVVVQIGAVTQPKSLLALLAQVLAGSAGAACLVGAAISQSRWNLLTRKLAEHLAPREFVDSKRCGLVLIGVSLVCYLAIVSRLFLANDDHDGQDEGAYLVTAGEVDRSGGPMSLLSDLYRGDFREANRHPLHIALLSISPTFRDGKLLSVLLGLASIAIVVALGVRSLGWFRTGLMSVLLATNMAFCRFSVIVGCEILLLPIVALAWFHSRGTIDRLTDARGSRRLAGNAIVAGGILALTWLTKGTGLLFTGGYVVWLLSQRVWPVSTQTEGRARPAWRLVGIYSVLAMASWLVVASPLLARNAQRFASLTYNVNSWLMFVDEFSDPEALATDRSARRLAIILRPTRGRRSPVAKVAGWFGKRSSWHGCWVRLRSTKHESFLGWSYLDSP